MPLLKYDIKKGEYMLCHIQYHHNYVNQRKVGIEETKHVKQLDLGGSIIGAIAHPYLYNPIF